MINSVSLWKYSVKHCFVVFKTSFYGGESTALPTTSHRLASNKGKEFRNIADFTVMQPNSRQYLWDILLYSGLGCFSYFFLVRFADIPLRNQDRLLTPEAFVAVMLLFNGVGLGMRYIQLRLRRSYPTFLGSRRQMVLFFVLSGAFLFLLNYLLLVSVKLLLDMPHPSSWFIRGRVCCSSRG